MKLVACREEFDRVLGGRRFAFSLLVHSDESSPMVDFLATSSVLQVDWFLLSDPLFYTDTKAHGQIFVFS